MFGYRVPNPDEAMLVSGGKHAQGVPFRVVVGHGMWIAPMFRRVQFLTLALQEAEVQEECVTKQGISLQVEAVIAFKVGADEESIVNAGQRFLSDQSQMPTLTGRIFAGHLRSIVGSMSVEEIVQERQTLATEVLDASKVEMAKIGLVVDSLQIQSIDDMGSGYINAMGQAQRADVMRQAAVAQAQAKQATQIAQAAADQAAAEAQQKSQQQQSNYAKETALVQAQNDSDVASAQATAQARSQTAQAQAAATAGTAQADAKAKVDKAQGEAAQAGPLAAAQAAKAVAEAQTALATQNAALRAQQLVAEVVKPAEADAEKIKVTAAAQAEQARIMAEAAVAGNRITLDQKLIELLPVIVEKAAGGLAGSNLTVLNGAEGIGEILTQVVSQGGVILDTLKASLSANGNGQHPVGASLVAGKTDHLTEEDAR